MLVGIMTNTTTQVALITGASRGLGLEIARLYAQRGMRLIVTARDPAPLQRAAGKAAAEAKKRNIQSGEDRPTPKNLRIPFCYRL